MKCKKVFAWGLVLLGCLLGAVINAQDQKGLKGPYGFLTDYSPMEEQEARGCIRQMVKDFGIQEFQFYDWFYSYSQPVKGTTWKDPFFRKRTISLETIKIYIDEIHRQGGRAWAYVQSVGAEEGDLDTPGSGIFPILDKNGKRQIHGNRIQLYLPNQSWARIMCSRWALEIKNLGFDGIHWDSLGPIAPSAKQEREGFHQFLKTSHEILGGLGLRQTFNFVNMSWWDKELIVKYLEFPYAEVWTPFLKNFYYQTMADPDFKKTRGVIAFYPSVKGDEDSGATQIMRMVSRWRESRKNSLEYLVVGDGGMRLVNEYFPGRIPLKSGETKLLKEN